ncbi:MAG TPA: cobalt transporter subunit CbtB [Nitrospiria bacterium]|nr:cobalt transporter subunit CbtB [Nitrospiria bacterium]
MQQTQVITHAAPAVRRAPLSIVWALGVVLVMQAVVMFGPSFAGAWAHHGLHSYRHSIGMACH